MTLLIDQLKKLRRKRAYKDVYTTDDGRHYSAALYWSSSKYWKVEYKEGEWVEAYDHSLLYCSKTYAAAHACGNEVWLVEVEDVRENPPIDPRVDARMFPQFWKGRSPSDCYRSLGDQYLGARRVKLLKRVDG